MVERILASVKPKMREVIEKLTEEFQKLHTGRANSALVENISITYYNTQLPLKQMANISIPEANQIVVTPFDKAAFGDIEVGIRNSGLGFNPVNDGRVIRITLPPMTEERRRELVKLLHKIAEEARIALRNLRHEVWGEIQDLTKSKQITEDDRYQAEDKLNKQVEDFNREIEQIVEKKETEILKI